MNSNYTDRGFLDLAEYGSRSVIEIMVKKLRNDKEFIERKGDRLYFRFASTISKINFFSHVRNVLHSQGYVTEIVEEIDHYEVAEREKRKAIEKSRLLSSQLKKQIKPTRKHEKVSNNKRNDYPGQFRGMH